MARIISSARSRAQPPGGLPDRRRRAGDADPGRRRPDRVRPVGQRTSPEPLNGTARDGRGDAFARARRCFQEGQERRAREKGHHKWWAFRCPAATHRRRSRGAGLFPRTRPSGHVRREAVASSTRGSAPQSGQRPQRPCPSRQAARRTPQPGRPCGCRGHGVHEPRRVAFAVPCFKPGLDAGFKAGVEPAISRPSGVMTIGCSSPTASVLCTRAARAPTISSAGARARRGRRCR